jgi:hypothetical protein
MVALLQRVLESRRPWLDYTAYAENLLAAGKVPWTTVDGAMAWLRQSQGLLGSSVVQLPIHAVVAAWLEDHPEVTRAMAARSRVAYPLKTLLGDQSLRVHLCRLAEATAASLRSVPLVLEIPSPRAWLRQSYHQAFPHAQVEFNDDAIDSAAAYIADFLRGFPQTEVAGVLLSEDGEAAAPSIETVSLYRPIFNLASHYRWNVGIRTPQANSSTAIGASTHGPNFWIAPDPVAEKGHGVIVPNSFWSDGKVPDSPAGCFRFATIPVDAIPEAVLEGLALLQLRP